MRRHKCTRGSFFKSLVLCQWPFQILKVKAMEIGLVEIMEITKEDGRVTAKAAMVSR